MRYLKTYKLFESVTDEFLSDIEYILLDIKELGLLVTPDDSTFRLVGDIRIDIQISKVLYPAVECIDNNKSSRFEISQEITDSLERLHDYVTKEGYFCIFDVGEENSSVYYQLSGSDMKDYIGKEVFFIDIIITNYLSR